MNRYELYADAETKGREAAWQKALELGVPRAWGKDAPATWTCNQCGETVGRSDNFSDYRPCRCQREAYEAEKDAYLATHWARVLDDTWERAGVPPRYQHKTLAGFERRPGTEKALDTCREYAERFDLEKTTTGLLIVGPFGSGKTHLAVATARAVVEQCLAVVRFVSTTALLAEVKAGDGRKAFDWRPVEAAEEAELVVLDDLGQEDPTPWQREVLFRIIDARYREELPTIITTNLADKQIADRLGGAFMSRLYEMTRPVVLAAGDYRKEVVARAG